MFTIPEAKKTSKPNLSIYISDTSTIKLNQTEEARALLVKRLNAYDSVDTGKVQKLGKEDWELIERKIENLSRKEVIFCEMR
ncbi:hypothetical protein Peur_061052 [Populus x canadensis]